MALGMGGLGAGGMSAAGLQPGGMTSGMGIGLGESPQWELSSNQTVAPEILDMLGGSIFQQRGQTFYQKGATDPGRFKLGTDGYNLDPLGQGRYNILKGDKVLGVHYATPGEAVQQLWDERNPVDDTEYSGTRYNKSGGDWADWGYRAENGFELDPATIRSEPYQGFGEDGGGERYYGKRIRPVNPYKNTGGGQLEDFENLGQLLAGRIPDWNADTNSHANRFYSQDNATQAISGLNAMYGTRPLMLDDKLQGYMLDLNPNEGAKGDWGYRGDDVPGLARIDNNGKTRSASQLWREYSNPEEWNKYGGKINSGTFLVKPGQEANLPGWLNKESRSYSKQESSGLGGLGKIMSVLGTVLSFTPLAPLGIALNTINALANDNPWGAVASLAGGALRNFGAAGNVGSASGGMYGSDLVGLGGAAGNGFLSAGEAMGGLAGLPSAFAGGLTNIGVPAAMSPVIADTAIGTGLNLMQGQNPGEALLGAAMGKAAPMLGQGIASPLMQMGLSQGAANYLGGASTKLGSLAVKKSLAKKEFDKRRKMAARAAQTRGVA